MHAHTLCDTNACMQWETLHYSHQQLVVDPGFFFQSWMKVPTYILSNNGWYAIICQIKIQPTLHNPTTKIYSLDEIADGTKKKSGTSDKLKCYILQVWIILHQNNRNELLVWDTTTIIGSRDVPNNNAKFSAYQSPYGRTVYESLCY